MEEEDNIEHFILNCENLSKVRNTILQKIITTSNTLGIEFHELSANEKLQHILDVTHFYSKLILNKGWIFPVSRFSAVRILNPLYNGRSCIIEPLK
jgi:hypothetical protein